MMYYQDTDSRMVISLPYEMRTSSGSNTSIPVVSANDSSEETLGGGVGTIYLQLLPEDVFLTERVWKVLRQIDNLNIVHQTGEVLSVIHDIVLSFRQLGIELIQLPPLRAFVVDDGSLLVEWIFGDFRIGFNIELTKEDSGWFLVASKKLGDIGASGLISGINIRPIIVWLFSFAIQNYSI